MVLRPGEVAALPPRVTPTLHGGTGVQRWERTCPHPTSRTVVFRLRDVNVSDGRCTGRVGAGGGGCTGGGCQLRRCLARAPPQVAREPLKGWTDARLDVSGCVWLCGVGHGGHTV